MNWNAHHYAYQVAHPWHWLGYGPNATNLAAVAALIAACATVAAAIFAGRAYLATLKQLRIARKQLELARKQFQAEVRRLEEERAANRRAALATYERTRAEEDSVRPRFVLGSGWLTGGERQTFQFKNEGATAATAVRVTSAVTGEVLGQREIVPPEGMIPVSAGTTEISEHGVLFSFRTSFGSLWEALVNIERNPLEEVRQVVRIYGPPPE